LTHTVLQLVYPIVEHTHEPVVHVCPPAVLQVVPQPPQLKLSDAVVTQVPLQFVLPLPQAAQADVAQALRAA
jgi:hypothetical protein